ncbi:MAG: hypothetical protein R3181_02880, partial [Rubricoccaceae bacterium]|nr:hypothetical protein [Rubricoccaceae bacterium]
TLAPPLPNEREGAFVVRVDEGGIYYFVEGVGGLLARDGREIVATPLPGRGEVGFHRLIAGIGLGLTLHQRGALTLHASAVSIGGGVAAFIGWKGMGKSTTAAAFYARGHRVVTDDLLVVRLEGEGASVVPGFPSLKLWPEAAAAALGDDPESLPRLFPDADKRARSTQSDFDGAPLPLRVIYVLDFAEPAEGLAIEPVPLREACIELVRHAFALRILGDEGETADLFRQRAQLARRVPVRRLSRRLDLSDLSEIVRRVEGDLDALSEA